MDLAEASDVLAKMGFEAPKTPALADTSAGAEAPSTASMPPLTHGNASSLLEDMGFHSDSPQEETSPPPEPTKPTEPPSMGFWDVTKGAFVRGALEGATEFGQGVQAALPGQHLSEVANDAPPETQDEISGLLNKGVFEGWSDPKWWGAQFAHGVGSSAPSLALGLGGGAAGTAAGTAMGGPAGGVVGGLAGGAAGFGLGSALQAAAPAYQRARKAGLSENDAMERALQEAGIAGIVGGAMGLAPGGSVFGRTLTRNAAGELEKAFRRPIAEAMTQIGLIQPAIGASGAAATAALEGRPYSLDNLATDWISNAFVGGGIWGAHALGTKAFGRTGSPSPSPDAEAVADAHAVATDPNVQTPEGTPNVPTYEKLIGVSKQEFDDLDVSKVPGGGTRDYEYSAVVPRKGMMGLKQSLSPLGDKPVSIDTPPFFSAVEKLIREKGPNLAGADQWMGMIRNAPGIKGEEVEYLHLPQYLADAQGKVSKDDLLAHIALNNIEVETTRRWSRGDQEMGWSDREGRDPEYHQYITEGPHKDYQEHLIQWKQKPTEPISDEDVYNRAKFVWEDIRGTHETVDGQTYTFDTSPERDAYMQWARKELARDRKPSPRYVSSHFREYPDVLAHIRTTERVDRDGKRNLHIEEIQSDWHQEGAKRGYNAPYDWTGWEFTPHGEFDNTYHFLSPDGWGGDINGRTPEEARDNLARALPSMFSPVPDAPFKGTWTELAVKAMLRYAADNGYDRMSWSNGAQNMSRYVGRDMEANIRRYKGLSKRYDEKIPSIVKKWAKQLGMDMGETRLRQDRAINEEGMKAWEAEDAKEYLPWHGVQSSGMGRVGYVEINPAAGTKIRMGFPLFMEGSRTWVNVEKGLFSKTLTKEDANVAGKAINDIARRMNISEPIHIQFTRPTERIPGRGAVWQDEAGYHIQVNVPFHKNAADVFATLAHEFGHIVFYDKFKKAPPAIQELVKADYQRWRSRQSEGVGLEALLNRRDNAVTRFNEMASRQSVLALTPERMQYWAHYEEWFAEQVARWATTSAKPMGVVDRFMKSMGDAIRTAVQWVRMRGRAESVEPVKLMKDWLDSMMSDAQPFAADIHATSQLRTWQQALRSFERDGTPEVSPVPLTPTSLQARGLIAHSLDPSQIPPGAAASAAHADRMTWMHKWMYSLNQLAEKYPHLQPLQWMRDMMRFYNQEIRESANMPLETQSMFRRLSPKDAEATAGLMDSWANMRYRTPDEIALNIRRHPSKEEFEQLVRDHGVSDQGLNVFKKFVKDYNTDIDKIHWLLQERAGRIKDPDAQARALDNANEVIRAIKSFPYSPIVRRGEFNVAVHDKDNNIVGMRRFTSEKEQQKWAKELQGKIQPDERIITGKFGKDVEPMFGLPRVLLDIFEKGDFDLSASQRSALKLLKYEHIENSDYHVPMDAKTLIRSHAKYFFHSGRFFARAKWNDQMRSAIVAMRELRYQPGRTDANGLDDLANFMTKHMDYVMNPKADFAFLRGLIFNLRLGFSPTTAGLYLTQTPLGTLPWLSSHFGDVKGIAQVTKSMAKRYNFYKGKEYTGPPDPMMEMYREAYKRGELDGGAAPALAAMSEDRNLRVGFGGNPAEQMWNWYQSKAGLLLHMADSYNREVAFDAAAKLALDNPGAKYLDRVVEAYPQTFKDLMERGWDPKYVKAYLAGVHTVEQTHFVYQRYARPQFMWGKSSAFFMFQFWKQNMLFTLWNYPSVAWRSLLIMAGMSGMMGLPFAHDIEGVLKAVGWKLFGKDWNLEKEIREWVTDTFNGKVDPDILLHGGSRYSMGIPQVLDMMGHIPYPSLDRSSAIGLGDVSPIDLGMLAGPTRDPNRVVAREAQDIAGAAFGFGFDVYQFLLGSKLDWNDAKRWERIMPHALLNASRAMRWYREGMERDQTGNPVVKFDPNDTVQMMEILARAAGYNPTRLTAEWDKRTAMEEVKTYWQLRRQGLLEQFWQAHKTGDDDAHDRVVEAIRNFNQNLPDEMRPISSISSKQIEDMMKRKMGLAAQREQGTAPAKEMPLLRNIQRLFPSADSVARTRVQ